VMSAIAALEPSLTPEQLDALADEIATFATRIDVAEHALLTRLRLFDVHEAWGDHGARSCAEWLSWRTNLSIKAAREKVRVARALASLPKVDALFGRGELSYSKVRAITRAATAESEQHWIDVALHASASQIERLARAYQRVRNDDFSHHPMDIPRDRRRFVRRSETPGGMIRIEMQLTPEEAAVVWSAMSSALEQTAPVEAPAETPVDQTPAGVSYPATGPESWLEIQEQRADAIVDLAQGYLRHQPRTLGSAYELVILTTPDHLQRGPDGVGGYLSDGTPVPLHIARMLACDGARIDVALGNEGELLDVGRRTRAIPSAIGRALWLRDRGCRVPGCGRTRHLHAHHIQPWAEGGPTKVSNLVLVCSGHHRMIHEVRLASQIRDGELVFIDARGCAMAAVASDAASGHALEELERFLRDTNLHIDASTSRTWDGSRVGVAEMLDWILLAERACEP